MRYYDVTFHHGDGSVNSEIVCAETMSEALVSIRDSVKEAEDILSSPIIRLTAELTEQ